MAFGSLQGIVGRAGGNEVIGRGIIDIGVSSYRVRHDMRTISGAIGKEAKLWGQAFRLAAVGIGAVVVAGTATVVGAIATAEKFNAAMAKVAGMTGVTTAQLAQMRKGVLALSGDLKQGPEELAKGLYFIASAGFRGVEALELLDQAAKAAAASGADLEVSADALVSIMNAYGLGADKARYASNILTKTVAYGKVEFQDLAKAIGPVSTISRVAGISLEEMGAALAMLTTRGLSARRATNTLWSTLRALTKPTEQQWKMIQALGLDFKPEDIKTDGLIKTLRKFDNAAQGWIKKRTGERIKLTRIYDKDGKLNIEKSAKQFEKMNRGYFDIMSKMVGQSNAFLVSQILLQRTGETFDFYLKRMKGFGDSTDEAYKKARKLDLGIVLGEATSKIQAALIVLGDKFLPTIRDVIAWLGVEGPKAVQWFSDILFGRLIPAAQDAGEALAGLVASVLKVFDFGGSSGKSPLETTLGIVIGLFETLFEKVEWVSNGLSDLLENPVVSFLAKIAAGLMAVSVAMSLVRTLSNGLFSKLGFATFGQSKKLMTGGSTVGAQGAAAARSATGLSAAASALNVAAQSLISRAVVPLNIAARELIAAAYQLGVAARVMAPGGRLRGPDGRFVRRPGVLPAGYLPGMTTAPMVGPTSVTTPAAAAGGNIVTTASKGLVSGMKAGIGGIGRILSVGMGLVAKVFLPLMVVDLVGSMAKEPLGDILSGIKIGNFDFKQAGEAMKEDFWGGLLVAAKTIFSGGAPVDMYVQKGLADTITIGNTKIDTMVFKNIGLDAAAAEALNIDFSKDNPITELPYTIAEKIKTLKDAISGELAGGGLPALNKQVNAWTKSVESMVTAGLIGPDHVTEMAGFADSPEMAQVRQIIDTAKRMGIDTTGAVTSSMGRRETWRLPTGNEIDTRTGTGKVNINSGPIKTWEQSEYLSVDMAQLEALAARTGIAIRDVTTKTIHDYREAMISQVTTAGEATFKESDLRSLDTAQIEGLYRFAQADTDNMFGALRAWSTNEYINAAKTSLKGKADFATLKTDAEKLDAALEANVKPLGESLTFLIEDLGKIQAEMPDAFAEGNKFLDMWGEKIEDAGNKAEKWMPVVNEFFAGEMGGKGYKRTFKGRGKDGVKGTADDVYEYFFGKKGDWKKITQDRFEADLAGYWQRLYEILGQAQTGAGAGKQLDLAKAIGAIVEQGLSEGMSIDNIRKGILASEGGDKLWELFVNSIPGGEQASEILQSRLTDMIRRGFNIKSGKLTGTAKEKTSFKKAILKEFNSMFEGDKNLKWKDLLPLLLDPKELKDWIATNMKPISPPPAPTLPGGGGARRPQSSATGAAPFSLVVTDATKDSYRQGGSQMMGDEFAQGLIDGVPKMQDGITYALETGAIPYIKGESPPPMGPLSGDTLPGAGRNIMTLIGQGAISASLALSVQLASALSKAVKFGAPANLMALVAGVKLGNQIAAGMASAISNPAWAAKIAAAIAPFLPLKSPAKKGPFAGAAWKMPYIAGQNLAGQMTAGLSSKELKLPGLQAGAAHGMKIANRPQVAPQTINVDRLELQSQADEASILTRLQFLQPMGR